MTPCEVLCKLRELLSDESRWTRGTLARSEDGLPVGPCHDAAQCWCLLGGIDHVTGDDFDSSMECRSILRMDARIQEKGIAGFNDESCHCEVMDVLSDAIARAPR